MVGVAALVVVTAMAWAWLWQPLLLDLSRLERDQPRGQSVLAAARLQAAAIASLEQAGASARTGDPRIAVERVLAERGLRGAATTLELQDARVRLTFVTIHLDALLGTLAALAKSEGLRPVEMTLTARVEPGTVRADVMLAR